MYQDRSKHAAFMLITNQDGEGNDTHFLVSSQNTDRHPRMIQLGGDIIGPSLAFV
jgi:hypothetical protein